MPFFNKNLWKYFKGQNFEKSVEKVSSCFQFSTQENKKEEVRQVIVESPPLQEKIEKVEEHPQECVKVVECEKDLNKDKKNIEKVDTMLLTPEKLFNQLKKDTKLSKALFNLQPGEAIEINPKTMEMGDIKPVSINLFSVESQSKKDVKPQKEIKVQKNEKKVLTNKKRRDKQSRLK